MSGRFKKLPGCGPECRPPMHRSDACAYVRRVVAEEIARLDALYFSTTGHREYSNEIVGKTCPWCGCRMPCGC